MGIGSNSSKIRNCGLTLVELLISVAILSVAVVLILQALLRGAYALTVAEHRFKAYTFAVAKLADLEMTPAIDPEKTKGEFTMGRSRFDWSVAVQEDPQNATLNLVTLTVGWQQGRKTYETAISFLKPIPPPAAP